MSRRQQGLLLGGAFLAGIGATAVAAWVQMQYENRIEERGIQPADAASTAANERLQSDLFAARGEAREAAGHIRALLRAPRVSESDHVTDRTAAQEWLRRQEVG